MKTVNMSEGLLIIKHQRTVKLAGSSCLAK